MSNNSAKILGIISIIISLIAISFWSFWGITETFHEGWYSTSITENFVMAITQYLSPMLILLAITIVSIYYSKIGAVIFFVGGVAIGLFVQNVVLVIPFFVLALLFWFSKIDNKKKWALVVTSIPIAIILVLGIADFRRVSERYDDKNYSARAIKGNGVELTWAPEGPGFPENGTSWNNAVIICKYLSEDGLTISSEPQNIWRLPTANEAVRSMTRNNENCGGVLDTGNYIAQYERTPDKESPIWRVYSKVIYLWTSTEIDSAHAFMICYDGKLWSRSKKYSANYLGFRAVK